METIRLKQFCAIVEHQSLSKAAQVTGISLSGLSRSMKILQEEVSQELLIPKGRGILVTEEGLILYQKAREVLQMVETLRHTQELKSQVRVGCLEVFSFNLMGQCLRSSPETLFDVVEAAPENLELSIKKGDIDFGFTYLPFGIRGVEHLKVCSFSLGVFTKSRAFASQDIEDIPFIVPSSKLSLNPLGTKERDGWPESLWERPVAAKVNLLSTAIDLCSNGIGAIFIPEFVARQYNARTQKAYQLEQRPFKIQKSLLKRDLYLLKREGTQESATMKRVTSGLRRVVSGAS